MNGELIPAVVAAGGGSVLLGSIYTQEHRRVHAMRASRERLSIRIPSRLDPVAAKAALSQLSGLPDHVELVAETIVSADGVRFGLSVPAGLNQSVSHTLTSTLPGLRIEPAPAITGTSILALRLFVPTPIVLRTEDTETATRALLGGLSGLREGETVVIRWTLRTTTPYRRDAKELLTRREPD
jgi:hypothetical protein